MSSKLPSIPCSELRLLDLLRVAISDDDILGFRHLLEAHSNNISKYVPALLKDIMQNKKREFFELMSEFNLLDDNDAFRRGRWFPLLDAVVNGDVEWIELLYKHKLFREKTSGIPLIYYALRWGALRGYESVNDPVKDYKNSEIDIKILKTLINLGENINQFFENETPITYAAKEDLWHCVEILLQNNAKIDCYCRGKTAREIIQLKKPELLNNLPKPDIKFNMLQTLRLGDESNFIKLLEENLNLCNSENDQGFTFLQIAIQKKMSTAVDRLLSCPDIDPNKANINAQFERSKLSTRSSPPIIMALNIGAKDMFTALLYHKDISLCTNYKDNNTIYHFLARDWKYIVNPTIKESSLTFLRDLFKTAYVSGVNILQKNNNGKTALQIASKNNDKELIYYYFQYGACCSINKLDLQNIPPEYLNDYLDKCVKTYNKMSYNRRYIEIDYSFIDISQIGDKCNNYSNNETDVQNVIKNASYNSIDVEDYEIKSENNINVFSEMNLFYLITLSKSHVHLLKHPVIRTFLYLKWKKVFSIYLFNFLVFLTFAICLSMYINDLEYSNSTDEQVISYKGCTWFLTIIFWLLILLREILQLHISHSLYLKSFENFLEVILLILVGYILFVKPIRELASISIILCFIEMTFMIGRNPYISTYVTIFIQVSKKSISLLIIFFPSIFAFAYGFHIIFKDTLKNEAFKNLGFSVFKTLIMLSGELEADEINFDVSSVLSRLLLVLFLVFIVIVFSNVLNALAISDTQAIVEEAELLNCIDEVHLYTKLENVWLKYFSYGNNSIFSYLSKWFSTNVCPLTTYYGTGSHYRLLVQENSMSFSLRIINRYIFGLNNVELGEKLISIYYKNFKKVDTKLLDSKAIKLQYDIEERIKNLETKCDETSNAIKSMTSDIKDLKSILMSLVQANNTLENKSE